jgi:hypothetical protein
VLLALLFSIAVIVQIAAIIQIGRLKNRISSQSACNQLGRWAEIMEPQDGQDNDGTVAAKQAPAGQDSDGTSTVAAQGGAGNSALALCEYPAWQADQYYEQQLKEIMTLSENGASQHDVSLALMQLAPTVQMTAIHNLQMYVCLHRPHALIVLRQGTKHHAARGHTRAFHELAR